MLYSFRPSQTIWLLYILQNEISLSPLFICSNGHLWICVVHRLLGCLPFALVLWDKDKNRITSVLFATSLLNWLFVLSYVNKPFILVIWSKWVHSLWHGVMVLSPPRPKKPRRPKIQPCLTRHGYKTDEVQSQKISCFRRASGCIWSSVWPLGTPVQQPTSSLPDKTPPGLCAGGGSRVYSWEVIAHHD